MNSVATPAPASNLELRFNCPNCNAGYKVLPKHLGRRTTCSKCNELITIAIPNADPARMSCPLVAKSCALMKHAPMPCKSVIVPPIQRKPVSPTCAEPLAPWQFAVGIGLCVIPPFMFAIWSLFGAVLLRAACSLCFGRSAAPVFAKAWWVSLMASLVSLPFGILNMILSAAEPALALPFGIFGLIVAACLYGAVYCATLRVTFGQGMLLWLAQLLMLLPLYIAFVALVFALD